jgi:transcriptional regulator with XRE-family HTH domain
MTPKKNIIGPQVRELRLTQKLTQGDLAARCGALGWDVTENTITKIETQLRCITDRELVLIARALRTKLRHLFEGNGTLF